VQIFHRDIAHEQRVIVTLFVTKENLNTKAQRHGGGLTIYYPPYLFLYVSTSKELVHSMVPTHKCFREVQDHFVGKRVFKKSNRFWLT
jgi:hypothetical protein